MGTEKTRTILSHIHSPADVRALGSEKIPALASEIRRKIIEVVGKNGGHLAGNLGVVELTIAIHRVFESPRDAIVFDVSHQCYTHKLLTGRADSFDTIRRHNGISGFTRRNESEHDFFDNGHASTSISQGLGLLTAWELEKNANEKRKVVVVIGDGALTGGMAFEALSHAGQLCKNLIVVLNDNQMSISENTGALSRYISALTVSSPYQRFRRAVDGIVEKIPNSKHHIGKIIARIKRAAKGALLSENLFTDLGFEYFGPFDGHDEKNLERILRKARELSSPVVVHVRTKKGKGYSPAEDDPAHYHGIGPFLISGGDVEKFDSTSFTEVFSREIVLLAEKNPKICAITAAMGKGTGLDSFRRRFPERFFDVGIAEEHAVTFSAGLSAGGMIPVVAIYSTFMQRAVDQIIHDIALPRFPCVIVLDRAGVVPGDGETHQGLFDIALFLPVPFVTMLSPASASDLRECLSWATKSGKPVLIRWPKSSCPSELLPFSSPITDENVARGILVKGSEFESLLYSELEESNARSALIITTGGLFCEAMQSARILMQRKIRADIFSLRFIKPLDVSHLYSIAKQYDAVVFCEDGVQIGGISMYALSKLRDIGNDVPRAQIVAFPDRFFSQGSRDEILSDALVLPKRIADEAEKIIQS